MKTKIIANTNARNATKTPAKISVAPRIPSDAGMAKVKISPNVDTIIRCRQIKVISTPQNGQWVNGGWLTTGFVLRSTEQLGHIAQDLRAFLKSSGITKPKR